MSDFNGEQTQQKEKKHHLIFDDDLVANVERIADNFDQKARETHDPFRKRLFFDKSDSYRGAIGIIEGMTKGEAVGWIQENSGGNKGAEMDGAGEVHGEVWSRQTACDVLSTWKEIFTTIASINARNSQEQ